MSSEIKATERRKRRDRRQLKQLQLQLQPSFCDERDIENEREKK